MIPKCLIAKALDSKLPDLSFLICLQKPKVVLSLSKSPLPVFPTSSLPSSRNPGVFLDPTHFLSPSFGNFSAGPIALLVLPPKCLPDPPTFSPPIEHRSSPSCPRLLPRPWEEPLGQSVHSHSGLLQASPYMAYSDLPRSQAQPGPNHAPLPFLLKTF